MLPRFHYTQLIILFMPFCFFVTAGHAFEAAKPIINDSPIYWEQRRLMMKGGKIKAIADKCQKLTMHHSVMAERASGWLFNHAIPYGGSNAFIDNPTLAHENKQIILIHKWLTDENRWEKYGAGVPGALERCDKNTQKASQQVINIMTKFGAIYISEQNDWIEGWTADN